jgi:hypothetical protein
MPKSSRRKGGPVKEPGGAKPRQFRLSEATLSELDYLKERYALASRAAVIRFLCRRAVIEERRKGS